MSETIKNCPAYEENKKYYRDSFDEINKLCFKGNIFPNYLKRAVITPFFKFVSPTVVPFLLCYATFIRDFKKIA